MKKHLLLLALNAFTINVKADNQYLDWDFTAAEGEDITVERVIALQFAKGEWDTNTTNMWDYLLNGQNMRVYRHLVDDIDQPQDYYIYTAVGHKYYDDLLHIYYVDYSIDRQFESDLTVGELIDRIIELNTTEYRLLSAVSNDGQTETYSNVKYTQQGWTVGEDDNGEYLNLGSTVSSPALDDYGNNASAVAQVLTDDSLRKSLLQYASIPLNDVKITITNSAGQVTSQHDYTQYLVNIQSLLGQVNSNLTAIQDSLGYSGIGQDNLAHQLGQWRTTETFLQGEILNALTNLTDFADYTDWLRLLTFADGYVTNRLDYLTMYATLRNINSLIGGNRYAFSGNSWITPLLGIPSTDWTSKISDAKRIFFNDGQDVYSFESQQNFLLYRYLLENEYIEMRKANQLTNIIDGVDLGRDWLNLATNDLNSFTYWLNQQTLVQNGTNGTSSAQQKFDAITNQYAQISLVGANPSNTAQNWDYFKRLEMLLAAIVYKQTDLSKIGEADDDNGTEVANDTSVSSAVSSAEQDVSTALSTVASSLSLTGFESSKNNLVSLWQIAVGAFDVPGSKPQITIFEQDEVGGENNR